jgi:hypothetical protein
MSLKTPRELWEEYCDLAPGLRAQFGLPSAIGYVVGEKLMTFAQRAETDPDFRAELPDFCTSIRKLFTKAELRQHFAFVEKENTLESDFFDDVPPEEMEELKEVWKDVIKAQEQRAWVKAMLLQTGS